MKPCVVIFCLLLAGVASADTKPATFDVAAVEDASSLQTKVLQAWQPLAKHAGVRQKLVEITVCDWWPGQAVRLPVTFCVPDNGKPCENVLLVNMGLGSRPAVPSETELALLTHDGVGLVMVGMGTLDAMEPKGKLNVGMKQQLLTTKDARFTPAWIWGMSDMRGLTAAFAERDAFAPKRVLVTGGSKRGIAAAVCGIYDQRVTAIMPVVTPIMQFPAGSFVRGSVLADETRQNEAFLQHLPSSLPASAKQALLDRDEGRVQQTISQEEARAAGWTDDEMVQFNEKAWDISLISHHLDAVRQKGLEYFYHVGANDNVCPGLIQLGKEHPDFPIFILPGGQHGGPKTSGFTKQTPNQSEADENLLAFARHHFFNARPIPSPPKISYRLDGRRLTVTVRCSEPTPQDNTLAWSLDRHPLYTFATEYDAWQSAPLQARDGGWVAEIDIPEKAARVDFLSTHTDSAGGLPFHFASPYQRIELRLEH